jgi:hypothetical protein
MSHKRCYEKRRGLEARVKELEAALAEASQRILLGVDKNNGFPILPTRHSAI